MDSYVKDPGDNLDYKKDWATWLPTGDTISTSTWTVPTGLTGSSESSTTTTATIKLAGGTAGKRYIVTNQIVTAQGRTKQHSFAIYVEEQ